MRFISPLDEELLKKISKDCNRIFTVEDNLRKGGFGSKVLEFYSDEEIQVSVSNLAFPDCFIEQGSQSQLFARYGLDGEGIYKTMKEKIGENYGR